MKVVDVSVIYREGMRGGANHFFCRLQTSGAAAGLR